MQQCEKIVASLKFCNKAFINGKQVDAASGKTFPTENPATGRLLLRFPRVMPDVDRAVKAARRTFERGVWPGMPPQERKKDHDPSLRS